MGLTATGVDVGAVVVAAGIGGGLGGSKAAGADGVAAGAERADGVAAGAEIVAVTVDGVTRKAATAARR